MNPIYGSGSGRAAWARESRAVCGAADLKRAVGRMARYSDTPMDFADATLVLLAETVGSDDIPTLDRRGFRTYRWGRNRAFTPVG